MSSMSSSGGTSDVLITPPRTTIAQSTNWDLSTAVKPPNLSRISKQFHIHSSLLLKSPLMNKFNQGKARPDERLRLVAEQYRINQRTTIAKAKRLKLVAEEKAAAQELLETTMLLEAAKRGDDFTSLDPETAISIVLQDAVDEVRTRLEDANLQVGRLLNIMNENGLHISTSIKIATPLDPQTMFTSPFPDSPCAISSYYSKSMDFSGDDMESDDFGSEGAISE